MPGGGTGFEELKTSADVLPQSKGDYVLETCEPGKLDGFRRLREGVQVTDQLACFTGDLVIIHGSVLHKSEKNTSPFTRFAYTFHMIESPPYAVYDQKNWLQPTEELPFSKILA